MLNLTRNSAMSTPNFCRLTHRRTFQLYRRAEHLTSTSRQNTQRSICTRCATLNNGLQTQKAEHMRLDSQLQVSANTKLSCRSTQARLFTSTSRTRVQPSPDEPQTDPQNIASPNLPDITNYYTLFPSTLPDGIPGPGPKEQSPSSSSSSPSSASFSINTPTLRKEFLRLQSQHHPDKYQTGSSAHQKALALSAFINAAYKTLSDPLLRAQYLLQLQYDIDVMSEDNAAHPTDQETLVKVMEAQERIEDAGTQEQVDAIKEENAMRMLEIEKLMGDAFENGNVEVAKSECVRLKYWRSLQGALDEWEPGKEVRLIH